MLETEHIHQLMREVGPLANFLAIVADPSEGNWQIAVDEDIDLFIEMVPARGLLVVTGEIGKPDGGDIKALYELLLRYAHAWNATEGLRMSLDAPHGALWLLLDCAAHGLTAPDLAELLLAFAVKLGAWRQIVAAHAEREEPRAAVLLDAGLLRG
jgi:hypothetical protein